MNSSYLPFIIWLMLGITIVIISKTTRNSKVKKQLDFLNDDINDEIVSRKNFVKCETFTSGRRTSAYRFNYCDLIFFKESFLIIGFDKYGNSKSFVKKIFISNGIVNKTERLKKINLHSFGNEVYIEFGESSFSSTSVEIRLKGL
jgi:hypothetical protein